MSQGDLRSLLGKKIGGGDNERTESECVIKQIEVSAERQKSSVNFKHVQKQQIRINVTSMINP